MPSEWQQAPCCSWAARSSPAKRSSFLDAVKRGLRSVTSSPSALCSCSCFTSSFCAIGKPRARRTNSYSFPCSPSRSRSGSMTSRSRWGCSWEGRWSYSVSTSARCAARRRPRTLNAGASGEGSSTSPPSAAARARAAGRFGRASAPRHRLRRAPPAALALRVSPRRDASGGVSHLRLLLLLLRLGHDLLRHVRRDFLVAREGHVVVAAAAGHGRQRLGVGQYLGHRYLGLDHRQAAADRLHPEQATAP